MPNQPLRERVLVALGMADADKETQDQMVTQVLVIAQKRLALLIPDMLTPAQLAEVETRRASSMPETEIMTWVFAQLPAAYDTMLETVIRAVSDELAVTMQMLRKDT